MTLLATLQIRMEAPPMPEMPTNMHEVHEDPALATAMADDPAYDPADPDGGGVATAAPPATDHQRPHRSERSVDLGQGLTQRPCPCGSGKKFKQLHGRV